MSLDFTVAIAPDKTNFSKELAFIKAALLYADKINLISPLAYVFYLVTNDSSKKDEMSIIRLVQKVLPFIKDIDPNTYTEGTNTFNQLMSIMNGKKYKNVPFAVRNKFKQGLLSYANELADELYNLIGTYECNCLKTLIDNDQVKISCFEHGFESTNLITVDYFKMLSDSLKNSYPLFDELSNSIMKSAIKSKVITLSSAEEAKITHAGLVDNYMQRLPAFEEATIDELIDIKKELNKPLVRFRGKMHQYSETIKTMPWNSDFEQECNLLYNKEVVPALLDIEEATKDNSFVKNLGSKFFSEEGLWNTCVGLVAGVAATGVIATFNDVISQDKAVLIGGTSFAATKLFSAYEDYQTKKQNIQNNDLFFYYKVSKTLNKKYGSTS